MKEIITRVKGKLCQECFKTVSVDSTRCSCGSSDLRVVNLLVKVHLIRGSYEDTNGDVR